MTEINNLTPPNHVGIILDGNRRWAKKQGLPTLEGHRQGAEAFKKVALHAFNKGVKYISAYVFSAENNQRSPEEVGYLMNLVVKAVENYLDEFHKKDIKIVILGRKEGLGQKVLAAIDRAEEQTKNNQGGTLGLCFNYGGHEEIIDAIVRLQEKGGGVTSENISNELYQPQIPALDLIIRTSGEQRISGFMLWRAAYAELYFTDVLWPDFNNEQFDLAIETYNKRNRRFGV